MFSNPYAPSVGGTEKSVGTFAADLRALGHEVLVVTVQAGTGEPDEAGLLRLSGGFGSPDSPDFGGVSESEWVDSPLSSALDRFRPEILHAHQPFLLGRLAFSESLRLDLPLVLTHHTLYARGADRVHWGDLAELESATESLAMAYSNGCDAVIAPTASVAEILREKGVALPIDLVATGIDCAGFAGGERHRFRERHGIPARSWVVGHLGRLIPSKRVAFLAEATARFLAISPGAWALFCGEGEAADEIRARFEARGVGDRLVLLGNLGDAEVADAYAAMDLFTFGSVTDTQGIVLLEAMAAGLPVLAPRATGPQDLVRDGVCGRLLDPEATPEAFAEALGDLANMSGSPAFARFAAAARREAGRYDRRRCAEALVRVYDSARRRHRDRKRWTGSVPELAELQRRVELAWRDLASRGAATSALLPSRGFPLPPASSD